MHANDGVPRTEWLDDYERASNGACRPLFVLAVLEELGRQTQTVLFIVEHDFFAAQADGPDQKRDLHERCNAAHLTGGTT